MSMIGMSMLASKGNVPDVQKVDIYFSKPGGLGKQNNLSFIMSVKTRKLLSRESRALVRYSPSANYLLLTENGEPESYSEALSSKEFVRWKKAINEEMVSLEKNQTCSLVRISAGKKASQRLWMFKIKEEQNSSEKVQRVTRLSKVEILHLWTRFIEPENDCIVAEHGFSSEITQSPGGSSDTSEGSKNSGNFKDSGRSDEEYSEDGASCKEGGFETPQNISRKEGITKIVDDSWSKEEENSWKSTRSRLVVKGFLQQNTRAVVVPHEIFSPVVKMTIIKLVLSIVAARAFLCGRLE
ncbi:retrovirus-related pol polyprotein from transposon TNT 1-94 [Tanacetum coccineum]